MSGTWERGLDPATAALDDDAPPEGRGRGGGGTAGLRGGTKGSIAHYQRPADSHGDRRGRGRDRGVAPMHGAGVRADRDGMRGDRTGDRDVFSRGGRSGTWGDRARGDFDRFRNGGSGGRGEGSRARRESNGVGRGGGEPEAKRPRVTSTIVVAGDEDTNGDGTTENGELDRWNTELPPASPPPAAEAAAATETAATTTTTPDDDLVDYEPEAEPEEDTASGPPPAAAAAPPPGEAKGQEGDQQPMEEDDGGGRRPVGKIVVVSGGGPRGRAANIGGVAGSGGGRGSLASRLGPPMGRPVMVKGGSGDNGGEGGFVPLSERPMPEPSKPELHVAYKDGDTKQRNRRCSIRRSNSPAVSLLLPTLLFRFSFFSFSRAAIQVLPHPPNTPLGLVDMPSRLHIFSGFLPRAVATSFPLRLPFSLFSPSAMCVAHHPPSQDVRWPHGPPRPSATAARPR